MTAATASLVLRGHTGTAKGWAMTRKSKHSSHGVQAALPSNIWDKMWTMFDYFSSFHELRKIVIHVAKYFCAEFGQAATRGTEVRLADKMRSHYRDVRFYVIWGPPGTIATPQELHRGGSELGQVLLNEGLSPYSTKNSLLGPHCPVMCALNPCKPLQMDQTDSKASFHFVKTQIMWKQLESIILRKEEFWHQIIV